MRDQTAPHDPGKARHREVLRQADDALERFRKGSEETRERLKRALAAYEERRRA